jgi:RimJ/RimL family protein N-acetyltransferase
MRYMPGGVARAALAAEMAPQTIALFAQCWTRDGFGPWAVERRSDGRLIGHLGFRHLPERGETELLYLFDLGVWGNGFAREGGRAALAAWDAAGGGDLVGFSHRENRRSQNVLLALGFAATGPLEIFGVPAAGFRRDAPQ